MECDVCGHEQTGGTFCGRCGAVVRQSGKAGQGRSRVGHADPSRTARFKRAVAGVGAVVAAVLLAAVVAMAWGGESDPTGEVAVPEATEVSAGPNGIGFATATDTALAFIDDTGGFVTIDLDTGERTRPGLPETVSEGNVRTIQRMMGGYLVVRGSREVRAVSLSADTPATLLADGATALPSSRAGVWIVDASSPEPPGTVWKYVNQLGATVHQTAAEPAYTPVHGVPEGLALEDGDGQLHVYDPTLDDIVDYLGNGPAHIADASDQLAAWCPAGCQQMRIHRAGTDEELALGGERVVRWDPGTTWLSDDGRRLAARVGVDAGQGATGVELHIYDTDTGDILGRTRIPFAPTHGSWTLDGGQFFYWIHDPNAVGAGAPTELGRYSTGQGFESVDLDPKDAVLGDFVALPTDTAGALNRRVSRPPDIPSDSGTEWSGTIDGTEWNATASYDATNDHICLERRAGNDGRRSCHPAIREALVLGVDGAVDDLPVRVIAGQVAPGVTEARVKMVDGEVVPIELRELPGTDHRVFAVAFAQDEQPQVVEAENEEGRVRSFGL